MPPNTLRVVLHYQPDLIARIDERRRKGESIDAITRWLCAQTGQGIGRESVRKWLSERELAT